MIRIIGGKYKRQAIDIPESKDVRPTQDRVREAVFSALQNRIPGSKCLDLFAGSGAYGFEALSRGATHVDFVDNKVLCLSRINSTKARLKCSKDVSTFLMDYKKAVNMFVSTGKKYDIIFLDPPYEMDVNSNLGKIFKEKSIISDNGILVIEQERELEEIEGYELKKYKYSYKRVGIYKRRNQI